MAEDELEGADRPNVPDPVSEICSEQQRKVEKLGRVHVQRVSNLVPFNERERFGAAGDIAKQRYTVNQYILCDQSTINRFEEMRRNSLCLR